jgi:hypothetical protein
MEHFTESSLNLISSVIQEYSGHINKLIYVVGLGRENRQYISESRERVSRNRRLLSLS